MKPWIANMGLREAEAFVPTEDEDIVCVSITEPKNYRSYGVIANISQDFTAILRLQFEDYDSLRLHPADAVLFSPQQAQQVAKFVTRHRGQNILVHCARGPWKATVSQWPRSVTDEACVGPDSIRAYRGTF